MIKKNGKRQTKEGIEQPNRESIRMLGEKENYKYLEIFEVDTIKEEEMKGNKSKKTSRKQALLQKIHQSNKRVDRPLCKKFGTIF